jgi:TolB-like protein/lipoprotein NlpI
VFLFLVEKRKIPIALPGTSRVTIAVLPFDNLSGDPAQEYFSDGITEELSTQLARLNPSRLGVIARVTAFRYKKSSKSIQEIANELGVQYLLEGSVRHDGDRVRITTQLIRASDQTHIWAQNYDRDLKDILALQSEVSESVAREVGLHVGEGIARPKPVDPWHYRAYLLAKSLAAHGNYRSAVEQLTDVAAKNPNDPEVWSSIGLVYLNIAGRFAPQKPAMTKAREAVNRALALDPNAIHPIAVNAAIKFYYDYDFQGAEAGFQRALEIDPDDATINFPYAMLLSASGRREEARKQAERLSLLEPASEQFACSRARIDYYGGRSEAVVADLDRTHPNNPSVLVTCYWFALAALQKQRTAEPLAAAERLAAIDFPEQQGIAAYLYGKLGKRQEAMDVLKKMEDRRARGEWISSYNLAQAHLGLGNYDRALDLLEQAANEPSGMLVYLKCDPMYEPLRSNPRFTALMRKVHIPGL